MSDATCDKEAAYRYTWPGRDESFICEDHSAHLRAVAAAMGLHLQLIPLPPDQETCAQKVHAKQK